jgi:hypothetical protein
MKHHDGMRRINKVDGGKGRARRAHSRAVRRAGKRIVRTEVHSPEPLPA